MRRQLFATIVLLTLLLAACGQPAPSPLAAPTALPVVVPTETLEPVPTLGSPLAPTALPRPTTPLPLTASPAVTDAATAVPASIPGTPTATLVLSDVDVERWSLASPDGKWIAQGVAAFPKQLAGGDSYYTRLTVSQADETIEWMVVDEWSELGLGYTTPRPHRWSQDGRYFYFTNRPVPDGCGIFVNGSDLQRVDLSDGSVTQVVPHSGLWLSLSPDETVLAYIGYGGRGLVLRDLKTGVERETRLDPGQGYAAGHIVWSPDDAALVLTLAIRPCSTDWAESTSIVRVDGVTLEQTVLIREDERLFITAEWPTVERVLLQDDDGNLWWMDAQTGDVEMNG